ncbi:MAG: helix-turn-helix domain-containing protein [Aphanothece sp. CMT-3BRIN-NPC111]|jgi:molecular chaperone GrpE (heat shock protein)|nr:helix-turn-helix domain-containing protein [Aphanothece sp. CMT-3BRIN-NPC111]
MSQSADKDFNHPLQQLMQRVGVSSFKALSRKAGVSERQVRRLRLGQVSQMRMETLLKISQALQVPITELLATFSEIKLGEELDAQAALKQEYQRLQAQIKQLRESLMQEFQQASLQVLESWLLQWPTAAYAAQQNPQLPAVRLLALVRPVDQLLQQWGVEAIASVGEEVSYDPRQHQLMQGTAQEGDRVKVRYTGYRQGDKLLYRAKVSPIEE